MEIAGSSERATKTPNKPKYNRNNSKKNPNLKKRQLSKPERGENVIYVSTKTKIQAILEKCTKLINSDTSEIIIYCLGAAIQRGILIALQICEKHVTFKIHTNTFTTELIDDLEPSCDDEDYTLQRRNNSALRIKVFREDPLSTST